MLPLVFEPTRPPVETFVPAGCLLVTVLLLPWVASLIGTHAGPCHDARSGVTPLFSLAETASSVLHSRKGGVGVTPLFSLAEPYSSLLRSRKGGA